jgi:hypothetical protein
VDSGSKPRVPFDRTQTPVRDAFIVRAAAFGLIVLEHAVVGPTPPGILSESAGVFTHAPLMPSWLHWLIVAATDLGLDAVVRVDPVTGDRTIVSDASTGIGPTFEHFGGIAVEGSGDLLVVDNTLDVIIRIDPITGDRTIISGSGTGSGPEFENPFGIAIEASGDLVVADGGLFGSVDGVFRVDPVTGNRTIISDGTTGTGPLFEAPSTIAVEPTGDLLIADLQSTDVYRVDASTGDRTFIICGQPVPTASQWSLIIMASILLVAGAVIVDKRRHRTIQP